MMADKRPKRSDRLLAVLDEYRATMIVMHNNPDPDAIAAGWALKELIESRLRVPTRLIGGGGIVRAENRQMVQLLRAPIELVSDYREFRDAAAVLVDCGPAAGNHLLAEHAIRPIAVIDHHATSADGELVVFDDVRPHVAASATIVASYLKEQRLEPDSDLATALLYAIRTETRGGATMHSRLDRRMIAWLSEFGNPSILAEIESAPLPRDYFADLVLALQCSFLYDDAAICFLPSAQGAEIVAEVADLLVRCEDVRRVLCAAAVDGDVYLSVRVAKGAGNAAEMIRSVVRQLGSGGGHQHRAGGKIVNCADSSEATESVFQQLRGRWLETCGVDRRRGTRLVPKRRIVSNL